MPPELEAAIGLWRQAEADLHVALARFATAPNPVNRIAVLMAWAALQVPLRALSSYGTAHPPAIDAAAGARARLEALRSEVLQVGWPEDRPIVLD
ncbi:MAG: hypothetical protein JSR91_07115 [Proteobacteria bacterium]|nr:hypothetical protein [Pseudomonadota bacterium]